MRADTSLQGFDVLYIAARNAEKEAFWVIGRFSYFAISMRALIYSFAFASMCVFILDVRCCKLLTEYLGRPPINSMISVKLLGRVKFGKILASFPV